MKKNRLFTTICLMAAILFTACTQDKLAEQGAALPDGEYPLQIGSVSITAESSEEPCTRVAENETDGMGSHWTGGERIGVRIGDNEETGIYIIKVDEAGNVTVEPDKPVYWKSTQSADVTAWYPATDGALDLGGQDNGLVYVLRATADNANHNTPVNLQFEHQLAKVRVVTKGTVNVGSISIQYPDLCVVNEGIVTSVGSWLDLDLYKTYYEGIGTCWEINLPVGNDIEFCRVTPIENSAIMKNAPLTPPVTLEASKVHTITITANREGTQTINLANKDYEITGDGIYYFSGTASHAIRVKGGNPEIYLEDAQISVSGGNAIDITGGASPTIHVMGENTVTNNSSTAGAGIYVAQGSTVTITGSSREDKLTATGGGGGAGIGGYYSYNNPSSSCGDIYISNVTIIASGSSSAIGDCASGIGAAGSETVGSINISNAVVYATGTGNINYGAAAIGGGVNNMNFGNKQTEFNITISDSEVHATKGSSYASYIGMAGDRNTSPANYDIISTAQITNSTIYNESGTEITQ